jgi:MbtH protein
LLLNPFDNEDGNYLVLTNDEGQYSLWPAEIKIPQGWLRAHGPCGRAERVDLVEASWTDLRPRSLATLTDQAG